MKDIKQFSKLLSNATSKTMKATAGVSLGFNDPDTWISTGNYALDYRISGCFHGGGIPMGKVTVFAGDSGAGKSYITSGSIVKNAQAQGIFVVLIDTENALDESWLNKLGVDTSEEKLLKINMAMIGDLSFFINEFVTSYRDTYGDNKEERPKVLFVIDSLGMLQTNTNVEQFKKGDLKGDMGSKPKQLKAFITNCVNMFGNLDIGMVATNHTYDSQDMFNPDPKVSGGSGFIYASSILVVMGLGKLKEDEEGTKTKDVHGIISRCKIMKTRFNKPFEQVNLQIPYKSGMDPYSGLFDMFESIGLFSKSGNSFIYVDIETGEEIKKFRKGWHRNDDGCLDLIMKQFSKHPIVREYEGENLEEQPEDFGADIDLPDDIKE